MGSEVLLEQVQQEAAVTVFSTPDDGCGGHPKYVE